MKIIIRVYAILLILLISNISYAEEIPDIAKKDPATITWKWSMFQKDPSGNAYMADFTKQTKSSDGTIFLPWATADFKTGNWTSNLNWMRINCEQDSIENVGFFDKATGTFKSINPLVYTGYQIGAFPKYMICGIDTIEGERIYGINTVIEGSSYSVWGWIPDKVKKEQIEGSVITLPTYQYDIQKRKRGYGVLYAFDCENKKITSSELQQTIELEKKDMGLWYIFYSACSLKDKIQSEYSLNINSPDPVNKQTSVPQVIEKNEIRLIAIEDAKKKCSSLGFKQQTEKFGNCVLELTK